jgi:hypothetical protein
VEEFPQGQRVFRPHTLPKNLSEALSAIIPTFGNVEYRLQAKIAAKAGFGMEYFGAGARGRLAKYEGRPDWSGKGVYCSEFTILAYQLACRKILGTGAAEQSPYFIAKDAANTGPHKLAKYLSKHPSFSEVGG